MAAQQHKADSCMTAPRKYDEGICLCICWLQILGGTDAVLSFAAHAE